MNGTPEQLAEQTNAAFIACNTIDGFRVPDGMRLEVFAGRGEWVTSDVPCKQWNTDSTYRLVPVTPPPVPLGPDDVPPGSVFRSATQISGWLNGSPQWDGVALQGVEFCAYQSLADDNWKLNRPRNRDADGRPTLWEPCSKPAATPDACPFDPGQVLTTEDECGWAWSGSGAGSRLSGARPGSEGRGSADM